MVDVNAAAVLAGVGRDGAVGQAYGAVGADAAAVGAARVLGDAAVGHLQRGAAIHHDAAAVAGGLVARDGTALHVERASNDDAAAVPVCVAARDPAAAARVADGERSAAFHPDDVARAALRALVGKAAVERVPGQVDDDVLVGLDVQADVAVGSPDVAVELDDLAVGGRVEGGLQIAPGLDGLVGRLLRVQLAAREYGGYALGRVLQREHAYGLVARSDEPGGEVAGIARRLGPNTDVRARVEPAVHAEGLACVEVEVGLPVVGHDRPAAHGKAACRVDSAAGDGVGIGSARERVARDLAVLHVKRSAVVDAAAVRIRLVARDGDALEVEFARSGVVNATSGISPSARDGAVLHGERSLVLDDGVARLLAHLAF